MNHIENIRKEMRDFFDPSQLIEGSLESVISPNEKYRMETSNYQQTKKEVNWVITKVEIYDNASQEKLFDFFGNYDTFFHQWLPKNGVDYLICAEDLYGGQTIIDLTNRRMESFSPGEDGFIWTDFYLSPDENKLAAVGCYWACPFVIKVYDFQNPMMLPLIELTETALLNKPEKVLGWLDNESVITNERERRNITGFEGKIKWL